MKRIQSQVSLILIAVDRDKTLSKCRNPLKRFQYANEPHLHNVVHYILIDIEIRTLFKLGLEVFLPWESQFLEIDWLYPRPKIWGPSSI